MKTETCPKCGIEKDVSEFCKDNWMKGNKR